MKQKKNLRKRKLKDGKVNGITLTQMTKGQRDRETESSTAEDSEAAEETVAGSDKLTGLISSPVTIIHPLRGSENSYALLQTLYELKPRFIVLYDPDVTFVRQIEVIYFVNKANIFLLSDLSVTLCELMCYKTLC